MIYLNERYKKMPQKGECLYFLQIGDPEDRLYKIGTTNNLTRRMKEHERYYNKDITVIWYRQVTSKWTTLKKEEDNKANWIHNYEDWEYLRNDRFIIPENVDTVHIKIRKMYDIPLNCVCWALN